MAWRPYLKDRLIEERPEGFVVIVPADAEPPIPLCCEVCDHVMRNRDDEQAHVKFGCCDHCSRCWAQPRQQAWVGGWRPSSEQVKAAEDRRPPLALKFDVG